MKPLLCQLSNRDLVRLCLESGNRDEINLMTIAAAGLALAFGLGGRDIPRNVLAGHCTRDVYQLGDLLVISGQEGMPDAIGMLNAESAVPGRCLVIPNT